MIAAGAGAVRAANYSLWESLDEQSMRELVGGIYCAMRSEDRSAQGV